MQDLSQYEKKNHIEIKSKYVSPLLAGSVALVGLVFALGVLVGGSRSQVPSCETVDPLAALDLQSGEPVPPDMEKAALRTFHDTLSREPSGVPTPASLEDRPDVDVQGDSIPSDGDAQGVQAAPVVLERPRHEESPMPEKVNDSEPGSYSLQVASFDDLREATLMVNKLKKAGHKSFLVSASMPERGGTWYRVRVGPFQSKQSAWQYKRSFEDKERLATFVVKRRSEG